MITPKKYVLTDLSRSVIYISMDNYENEERRYREARRRRRRRRRRARRAPEMEQEVDKDLLRSVGHRLVAFLVAVVLIVVIFLVAFGGRIKQNIESGQKMGVKWFLALLYPDKYSYAMEMADLNEVFSITSPEDTAIILGDEMIASRARYMDGTVYFSLDTVRDLFTDRFYHNEEEHLLLYTTASAVYEVHPDEVKTGYTYGGEAVETAYIPARYAKDGQLYLAADYVRLFADFTWEHFPEPNRVQVYTVGGNERVATLQDDTSLRQRGGIKSGILCKLKAGTQLKILETMDNWTKVHTDDGFIGYVENDKLDGYADRLRAEISGAYRPEEDYSMSPEPERVMLGFHQLSGEDNGKGLKDLCADATGMNVIAPTWFFLDGSEKGYKDIANANYVERAHGLGLKVWPLLEDMTNSFDEYAFFSSTQMRGAVIDDIAAKLKSVGADGLNVDCENIDSKTGPHFVQFLRELSIKLHAQGMSLSVDDYVPNEGNRYFNLHEQGYVADFVIMMGYDEHWATSPEAGSVASLPFVDKGIQDCLKLGVPENKFVLALPFFTRIWKTEGAALSSDAVGLDAAKDWTVEHGLEMRWDDELGQYYGEYKDGAALYNIWLEDGESLKAKLSVAKNYGVNSIAAWRLGLEGDGIWSMINAELE